MGSKKIVSNDRVREGGTFDGHRARRYSFRRPHQRVFLVPACLSNPVPILGGEAVLSFSDLGSQESK
jgi:hypothetical protein